MIRFKQVHYKDGYYLYHYWVDNDKTCFELEFNPDTHHIKKRPPKNSLGDMFLSKIFKAIKDEDGSYKESGTYG